MCSLAESNLREDLLRQGKDFPLIYTTELCVDIEVLLVQTLHDGVLFQKSASDYLFKSLMESIRTINALRGALSVRLSARVYLGEGRTLLTSLLDDFGTCSLCVVRADNAVEAVLEAKLADSIAYRESGPLTISMLNSGVSL